MLKNKQFWGIVAATVLIIASLAVYFWPVGDGGSSSPTFNGSTVTFSGADLSESKDGALVWRLKANNIEYNPTTKDVLLTDMTGEFFRDGVTFTVTAPKGQMTNDRKNLVMTGGIKGVSTDGVDFTTEELDYDNVKKFMASKGAFTYKRNNVTITGDKLEADMVLQQIKALGHARLEGKQ